MTASARFQQASRDAFAFLAPLGYAEVPAGPPATSADNEFALALASTTYVFTVIGIHYGAGAYVRLFHVDGREAPPSWFVPIKERKALQNAANAGDQESQVRAWARIVQEHCMDRLGADFDRVANDWKRSMQR